MVPCVQVVCQTVNMVISVSPETYTHNFVYSSLQSANIMQFAKAKICICEVFKRKFIKNWHCKITWLRVYKWSVQRLIWSYQSVPELIYYFVYSSLQSATIMQFAKAKIFICEGFKGHFFKIHTVKSHGYLCTNSQHTGNISYHSVPELMYNFVYSSLQSANIMHFAKAKICIWEVFKGHYFKIYTVKSHGY